MIVRSFWTKTSLRTFSTADASGFLTGQAGAILVQGPSWYLQSGAYRVLVEGEIEGSLDVAIVHDLGIVATGRLDSSRRTLDVALPQDARSFEVVVRSTGPTSKLRFEKIEIQER